MEWYYAKDGQQHGPVSEEQLLELKQNGEIAGSSLVWNDTMTDWVPFDSVPGLAGTPADAPPPMDAPGPPAPALTPAPIATTSTPGASPVPTYLWQSIVVTVLCCIPLGIPAIVFATKVGPAVASGDLATARENSKKAKMWCWIALGVGLVVNIAYFALVMVGALADSGAF